MIKLKDILNELTSLNEDPDGIEVDGAYTNFESAYGYTFYVYYDYTDSKFTWVAYDYINDKIISQNPKVVDEIYNVNQHNKDTISLRKWPAAMLSLEKQEYLDRYYGYNSTDINNYLDGINDYHSHNSVMALIVCLKRGDTKRDKIKAAGRVFLINDKYYFAFWDYKGSVMGYKRYIIDFLDSQKIKQDDVSIEEEDDTGNIIWMPFKKYFNLRVNSKEISPEQEKLRKIKQDLHINKGVLDKAILQVLQTRPKSTADIISQLEKNLKMPMAKIRHIYGELPLGRVGKALKEYISKL